MFYVDEYGKIVAYDKNGSTTSSTSSDAYAYVLNATDDADTWGNNNIRVQILDKDGKVYDAYLADTVKIDDAAYAFGSGDDAAKNAAAAAIGSAYKDSYSVKVKDIASVKTLAEKMVNKIVTYKANSNGEVSAIAFAKYGSGDIDDTDFQMNKYAKDYEYDEDNKEIRVGGTRYDVDEDTVVFFIKGNDAFTAGTDYVSGTASKSASKVGSVASLAEKVATSESAKVKYPAAIFDDNNGVASVIVLWNTIGGISPSNNVAVISSVGTARIDDEDVESVEYYMNGELKTSYTDPDYNGFTFADEVQEGDIVKLALSADGTTITDAAKVFTSTRDYTKADENGALIGTAGTVNDIVYGPVYDYTSSNKRIRVAKVDSTGTDFTNLQAIKANNANVYVFDPNRRNNKIEVGDASDVEVDKTLRDGTPGVSVGTKKLVEENHKALGLMDYAVGVEYDGDIIDVVIYKAFDFGSYTID